MGHGHGHLQALGSESGDTRASRHEPQVSVAARSRLVLLVVLGTVAAATLFGLVRLWPTGDVAVVGSTDFAAPGVTFPEALVRTVAPVCPATQQDTEGSPTTPAVSDCGTVIVALVDAPPAGAGAPDLTVPLPPTVSDSKLRPGDRVQLMRVPAQSGVPESYSFMQVQRGFPLALMLAAFVLVVAAVARWRGVLALVGLGVGGIVVVKFILPALLEGHSGTAVALIGSCAIMFVVLYLAHGLSIRTSTALAGTFFGVAITAVLGGLAVDAARLSGVASDEGAALDSFVQTLSARELLTCAIIVAGLGVLNDVTITQSSAVWELRSAAPHLGRLDLFRSGMRIGRDHIASTIYTIVFAYAGAALPVLMLLFLYDRPVLDLLQAESLAEEIVRTLASAIGLVLAVPATTAIAALTVGGVDPARTAAGRSRRAR